MKSKLQDKIFKLYSCCQLVEGYNQSIIYDIQRCKPYYIPNEFKNFLFLIENKKLNTFVLKNEIYKANLKAIEANINYHLQTTTNDYVRK